MWRTRLTLAFSHLVWAKGEKTTQRQTERERTCQNGRVQTDHRTQSTTDKRLLTLFTRSKHLARPGQVGGYESASQRKIPRLPILVLLTVPHPGRLVRNLRIWWLSDRTSETSFSLTGCHGVWHWMARRVQLTKALIIVCGTSGVKSVVLVNSFFTLRPVPIT